MIPDYRGDLRYVLQPEYQDNASLSLYAFQYKYDARHNVTEKTLPGADPVKYAYDKANRMIYSQDGVQRQNNRVTFMLYDIQGRLVLQGNCYSSSMPNVASTFVTVTRGTSGGVGTSGYTTNISLSSPIVEQVHYYDDYNFKVSALGFGNSAYTAGTVSAKGLETGSRIATLEETPTNCYTVNHYDIKGRNTKTVSSNHLSGYETVTTTYGSTDKPMTVTHVHSALGKATQTEVMTYTYDQADRLLTLTHKLNNNTAVTLQDNTYDNYGRLISRDLLNCETVTYNYNIRNWLTSLSSTNFTESLFYYNSSNQRFNGNISRLTWTTSGTTRGYNFTYDKLNRLVSASYGETGSLQTNTNRYSTSYTYDKNGNFLTLTRRGLQDGRSYGLIDDLTFTLNGNQVTKIEDAATDPTYNGAFNFRDGASQSNEYTYDKNGNMTKDLNKNISSIQYNSLNLPSKVSFSNGKYMDYVYSATGEKRSVTYNVISSGGNYTYCDNFIYYNGSLNKILVDGGYISISGTTPTYHYYLKDHLGNNRVVVDASGTVKQVTHYYPFGGFFGESTGGSCQSYKYNGKEFERLISEDWYDYGARHMDGMRFTTMDPMAEKYYNISPYAYCAGDPMNYNDENGDSVRMVFNKDEMKLYILDMDNYNRKQELNYVSYEDYKPGKNNQVLVIPFVFSGGEVGEDGSVSINPDRKNFEKELPNGVYDILDNSSDDNLNHSTWYRLDKIDNSRYNDKDDTSGRSGFRLHLGTVSYGCVTINKDQNNSNKMWSVLSGIMGRTSSTRVKEKRGRQWLNPLSQRTWYGKMVVIGGK